MCVFNLYLFCKHEFLSLLFSIWLLSKHIVYVFRVSKQCVPKWRSNMRTVCKRNSGTFKTVNFDNFVIF